MPVRGIRGAVQASADTSDAIGTATKALLREMVEANGIGPDQIISVFFTTTVDLTADYPAAAARQLGWVDIPLLGAQEMEAREAMPRVIRVLMHVETERTRAQVRHIYLGEAVKLRPDWNHQL